MHANAAKPVKVPALAWLNNFLASVHLFLTIEVCLFPHLGRQGVPTRRRWRGGDRGAEGRRPRPSVFPGSNESTGHRECNIHCEWGIFLVAAIMAAAIALAAAIAWHGRGRWF